VLAPDAAALPRPGAWRALLAVTGGVSLAWALHNGLLLPWEIRHVGPEVREPALVALRILVWIVPVLAYLSRFDPRPRGVALGLAGRLQPRGLVLGALVGAGYLTLVGVLLSATGEPSPGARVFAAWLVSLPALYAFLQVVIEEVFCRGFLLGQLVRHISSRRAQLVTALFFAAMHLPAWIAEGGIRVGLIPSAVMVFALGLVLGFATRAGGTIHLAIVIHLANNLLAQWFSPD
jgi:membrane protease YdiL (CAAX protease family)